MLGVVGLLVPEVYHLPFFKAGTAVYDNFFQVWHRYFKAALAPRCSVQCCV